MALRELLAHFGIKVDHEELEKGEKKIDHLKERMEALEKGAGETSSKLRKFAELLAVGIFAEGIKEFVHGQIEAGAQLKFNAEKLGVSTEELQKFQLAAQESGASAEDATTGLRFLNRNLGEAVKNGGEAAQTFSSLKIEIKDSSGEVRPVNELMIDLADALKNVHSQGERTAIAMKILGRGGAALLPMLQEGGEGLKEAFEDFDKLGGGIGEDFAEDAHHAERETVRLNFALGGLKSRIAAQILPGMVNLTRKMTGWIAQIVQFAKKTTTLRSAFIALKIGSIAFAFARLLKIFGGVRGLLTAIRTGLLRFVPMIAIVTALYLIFDDLYALFTGGKSAIGYFIDKMYGIGTAAKVVEEVKAKLVELENWFETDGKNAVRDWTGTLIDAVQAAIETIMALFNVAKAVVSSFTRSRAQIIEDLKNGKQSTDVNAAIDAATKHFSNAGDIISTDRDTRARVAAQQWQPGQMGREAPKQEFNITVNGASDPVKTGEQVRRAGRQLMNQGAQNRNAYAAVATGPVAEE